MYPVSAAFREALIAPIREVTMRVTALDSNLVPLMEITSPTAEGTVYVDVDRATRRTAQLRVINKDGAYTPKGSSYSSLGTNAIFWWDKVFRIEYGVKVGESFEYVPIGTFMVDRVDVLAEKGVSVVNVDGSDMWKRFTFSTFAAPVAYAKNTDFNTIISAIATGAGVTSVNLDPLSERSTTEKQTQVPVYFEAGDNRGEMLKKLAAEWNLEVFFDVFGTLTTRSFTGTNASLDASIPVWEFSAGEDAIFLNITKSKSGDTIFNHVVVTGENDDGTAVVRAEAIDNTGTTTSSVYYTNQVGSPTSVAAIGDRVLNIRSKTLRTTAACLDLAKAQLLVNMTVEEDITLPSIVNPAFEGNDVIRIRESISDTDDKFYLRAFDIPMRSSTQEIHVKKVRSV